MSDTNEYSAKRISVAAIIEKSRRVAALRPLRAGELDQTVQDWIEIIGDRVPADRLDDVWRAAMRDRQIRTALTPSELLTAWRQIAPAQRSNVIDFEDRGDHNATARHRANGARFMAACDAAMTELRAEVAAGRIAPEDLRFVRDRHFDRLLEESFAGCGCDSVPTFRCPHCRDKGFQHVRVHRGADYWSICARPCVCDAAPIAQRSAFPLRPPNWTANEKHEWTKTS